MQPKVLALAAIFGASGVALGAWQAHGLSQLLSARALDSFGTAVGYQQLHAVGLLLLGWCQCQAGWQRLVVWCWSLGILCFSGSIYGLTLLGWSWLGPVTPVGGVLFIGGWLALLTPYIDHWKRSMKESR